jgi:hypothetical protein
MQQPAGMEVGMWGGDASGGVREGGGGGGGDGCRGGGWGLETNRPLRLGTQ